MNYKYITSILISTCNSPLPIVSTSYYTSPSFDTSKVKIERGTVELKPNTDFKRYIVNSCGISPRTIPSQKEGMYVASSYEYDEYGHETEESIVRIKRHDKRFRKFECLKDEIEAPKIEGSGDITILSWGSTKGCVKEAQKLLEKDGIKTGHLHIVFISPFHDREIAEFRFLT